MVSVIEGSRYISQTKTRGLLTTNCINKSVQFNGSKFLIRRLECAIYWTCRHTIVPMCRVTGGDPPLQPPTRSVSLCTLSGRASYHLGHRSGWHTRYCLQLVLNPLMGICNHSATSKLVNWPLIGWLLSLVQRGVAWAGPVPDVTAHPSTASVSIIVLLHNGPLLCSFKVPIKGLNCSEIHD